MLEDGAIIEMRMWRVPAAVPPSPHEFKYSLFHGRPGEVVVLFDNERGKGDHRHIGTAERKTALGRPPAAGLPGEDRKCPFRRAANAESLSQKHLALDPDGRLPGYVIRLMARIKTGGPSGTNSNPGNRCRARAPCGTLRAGRAATAESESSAASGSAAGRRLNSTYLPSICQFLQPFFASLFGLLAALADMLARGVWSRTRRV